MSAKRIKRLQNSGRDFFCCGFWLIFCPLDPDPWIRIQETKILRILSTTCNSGVRSSKHSALVLKFPWVDYLVVSLPSVKFSSSSTSPPRSRWLSSYWGRKTRGFNGGSGDNEWRGGSGDRGWGEGSGDSWRGCSGSKGFKDRVGEVEERVAEWEVISPVKLSKQGNSNVSE